MHNVSEVNDSDSEAYTYPIDSYISWIIPLNFSYGRQSCGPGKPNLMFQHEYVKYICGKVCMIMFYWLTVRFPLVVKALLTFETLESLLSRVDSHMRPQTERILQILLAYRTLEMWSFSAGEGEEAFDSLVVSDFSCFLKATFVWKDSEQVEQL